jgi:hypothetical protein
MLGEVHPHALPEAGRRRRSDGDAALLLLLHPVHGRGAIMHFANLVIDAGVEQDALGRRRLSGIDVRGNANVAIALNRSLAGHFEYLPYLSQTALALTGWRDARAATKKSARHYRAVVIRT